MSRIGLLRCGSLRTKVQSREHSNWKKLSSSGCSTKLDLRLISRFASFLGGRGMLENANGFVRLGDSARDARNWVEAREAYAQAVQLDPSMDHIWVQYGHALKETGHLREAESAYRSALVAAPEVSDTYLQLGHVLKLL